MNYKEMIPVLEQLRQSQSDWLVKVQAHAEAHKDAPPLPTPLGENCEHGCMPVPPNVTEMLKDLYGPDLKVLGLNGYTEQLLWKSGEDTKTLTLTSLIENTKNS